MRSLMANRFRSLALLPVLLACLAGSASAANLRVLFLGDNGPHQPARRFEQLAPILEKRGIELTYTDDVRKLNPDVLRQFDGLLLYANIDRIEPDQAQALLNYVAAGKGFIPLHCASYCFRNAPEVVALIGAQFKSHGTGIITTQIADPSHPVLRGFGGFSSWDETYLHTLHNDRDRAVLEYREGEPQADGQRREPWTWVRTHGQGRVFYSAWGHDLRTWCHPGFHNLVERGIRWACGSDPALAGPYTDPDQFTTPEMTSLRQDVKPFEYVDVGPKIPDYTPGAKWGAQAAPRNMMQLPLSPEESGKHMVTPVGFEVRLFVSENDLGGKPIAMNWDEQGRLWVCETVDYPNELQPAGTGHDHIRICEDTDGDGRADRFTLFADQLSIPTAIAFARGGAIVQNGTETLFLKDTNGDGRADVRNVLISGWTLGDTHGGVSNFRYGLDNWIWGMQGYNNSAPVINGQAQQSFRMGFFRFRLTNTDPPQVAELEFIRSTNNNTWGLGFSEEGLVFGSTANHNPSVFMPIPNRYYERVRNWSPQQLGTIADTHMFHAITDKVRQVDHHGGYTAGAGHALYTARNYPAQWWNKTAFVCEPTGHLVGTFVLHRQGAGFQSHSPCNLLASDDEWTSPILAEVGPDGNVWVIDWYNYIVQHNPTPQGFETGKGNAYVSDLRDKKHGRIYRLVYTGHDAGSSSTCRLQAGNVDQLLAGLTSPTMFCRLEAQRLLVERGKQDIVPQLIELINDPSTDAVGLNVGAIHALWTLHGLGALNQPGSELRQAVQQALSHPSAGVRRNALEVLPHDDLAAQAILARNLMRDSDAQVQLAALLALADMPASAAAGKAAADLASDPEIVADPWLSDGLTSAAAMHAQGFLAALAAAGQGDKGPDPLSGKTLPIARIVSEHLARGNPSAQTIHDLTTSLANADPRLVSSVLEGLAAGWPKNYSIQLGSQADSILVTLLQRAPAEGKSQLIRLAPLWGSGALQAQVHAVVDSLLSAVKDGQLAAPQRIAAARQLLEFQPTDAGIVDQLLQQISPQTPPDVADGVIDALQLSNAPELGEKLIGKTTGTSPAIRTAAIRTLLARPATTAALLAAVQSGRMQLTDLSLEQRQSLNNHPDAKLRGQARKLLSAGGGLPNPDRERVFQEKLPLMQRQGDIALGKALFKKHCMKCHKHSGEGESIGPDLTGMAVHPKKELLVHILDPSRSVEGNFRLYTVVTTAGRILTGMLASETRTSIELIDTEAKRHPIPRDEIEELIASRTSLMPEGFEKQLSDDDFVNLLEFLTDKGPFLPIPLDKYATIVSTKGMFYDENAGPERLIFPDWKPKAFGGVPFLLVDPQGEQIPNVIMLNGPQGKFPPQMPRSVTLPCHTPAKAIHFLSGVSGWGATRPGPRGTSMIVRLHYADGQTEDHELVDGEHFADYIRVIDVPKSQLAFQLRSQQIRYLSILPQRNTAIDTIELVKGPDRTAPIVMAVTVETLQ